MPVVNQKRSMVRWIGFTTVCLVTVVTVLYCYGIFFRSAIIFSSASPRDKYNVIFAGSSSRPFFFTATISLNVWKGGELYYSNPNFYSGDSMDISFDSGFPNREWIEEDIFRLSECTNGTAQDTVVIENNSNQVVRSIQVSSVDRYLLFDVKPRTLKILKLCPMKGDFGGIYVEAEIPDRNVLKKGDHFPDRKISNKPLEYRVGIDENSIRITSD